MSDTNRDFVLNRARAIRELQLQVPISIGDGKRLIGSIFPVEFLDEESWETRRAEHPVLLLSPARATILGFIPQHGAVAIEASKLSLQQLWQLAAGQKKDVGFKVTQLSTPEYAGALVKLAKDGGILPALLLSTKETPDTFRLTMDALMDEAPTEIMRGETVMLPIEESENSTITSFRTRHDAGVHLALIIGTPDKAGAPLVRVHSACVTGDLLGSLRCDCGGQLRTALGRMKEEGGILLYLHQEGRSIGITSKLRAYALQQQGIDTFAANEQLGFEEDERDFSIASAMLKSLGFTKIRLLTNNPDKVESFGKSGITIAQRVPLTPEETPHNSAYLQAKQLKRGHHS